MEKIGANFKYYRNKFKLSQDQAGEKLGVTKSYISKIENDSRQPTMEFLVKAADLFQCDVADFFSKDSKVELDAEGFKWAIFGSKMKAQGVSVEQLEEWVKAIKAINNDKKD